MFLLVSALTKLCAVVDLIADQTSMTTVLSCELKQSIIPVSDDASRNCARTRKCLTPRWT